MRQTYPSGFNDQLQSWLRTLVLIGSIVASIVGAAVHIENRLTSLELGLKQLSDRVEHVEQQHEQMQRRR